MTRGRDTTPAKAPGAMSYEEPMSIRCVRCVGGSHGKCVGVGDENAPCPCDCAAIIAASRPELLDALRRSMGHAYVAQMAEAAEDLVRQENARLQQDCKDLLAERRGIVGWLRKESATTRGMPPVDRSEMCALVADIIEEGRWHPEKDRNST